MNSGSSLKKKALFTNTALLGLFLMMGGCTKVDVRVTGFCCSSSEELSPTPACNLPEKAIAIAGYKQENNSVCWAATAQMVINHYLTADGQSPITQCSIVDGALHPFHTCCGVMESNTECFQAGLPETVFNRKGFTYAPEVKDPPDREDLWGKLTNQICEDKPLILAEYWGAGGHSSVIYGFGGNGLTGERWVDIYDHFDPPITDILTGELEVEQINYDAEIYYVPGNDTFGRTEVYYTFDIQPQ
jgi:hypothetical protein